MNLEQRIVLITGAVRGSGPEIVSSFIARGAIVAAIDPDTDGLRQLKDACPRSRALVHTYTANALDPRMARSVIERINDELGPVSVLICRPKAPESDLGRIAKFSDEGWPDILEHSVVGPLNLIDAFRNGMVASDGGCIVIEQPHSIFRLGNRLAKENTNAKGFTRVIADMVAADNLRVATFVTDQNERYSSTVIGHDKSQEKLVSHQRCREKYCAERMVKLCESLELSGSGQTVFLDEHARRLA